MSNQFIEDLKEISAFYDQFEGLQKALTTQNSNNLSCKQPRNEMSIFAGTSKITGIIANHDYSMSLPCQKLRNYQFHVNKLLHSPDQNKFHKSV
jgi:hypothetical protein